VGTPIVLNSRKVGLVLAGGGAKGAYHIGAWQAFAEAGIRFSAFSGTSIGALNARHLIDNRTRCSARFLGAIVYPEHDPVQQMGPFQL
jgi:predicted patatin/cPLA2 family phospholipase